MSIVNKIILYPLCTPTIKKYQNIQKIKQSVTEVLYV